MLVRHQQLVRLLECGRQHSIEAVLKLLCAPRRDAAGDRAATLIFLAEGLKPKTTGKKTSAAEMSATGVWSQRNPNEATAEQGPAGHRGVRRRRYPLHRTMETA